MLSLLVLGVFLQTADFSLAACKCGRVSLSNRIVGGSEAPDGAFPWMVSIKTFTVLKGGQIMVGNCGGSIINSRHVLTAAHCVVENGNEGPKQSQILAKVTYVAVGVLDNSVLSPSNVLYMMNGKVYEESELPKGVYRVEKSIPHEQYNSQKIRNDIALLRLSKPIEFGPKVGPVCLENSYSTYNSIYVSGWGNRATGVSNGPKLFYVNVKEIPSDTCLRYRNIVPEKQVCYESGRRGTCQGDSGGPLVVSKQGAFHQVAVVSFGGICEDPNTTNVGTRVSYYLPWIKSRATTGTWCTAN